jgi:uroporphyrinogen decarboxylase
MRQAGRYLPEYRELRAEKGGFLELVYDSDAAAEITVQPIRRFAFDGAILFSDILIVPHAMGQGLEFLAGEGPKMSPTLREVELDDFTPAYQRFNPIYETVRKTRAMIADSVTMLGFAGSPWTVATYMIAGEGSKDQGPARLMAYRDAGRMQAICDAIAEVSITYLRGQIDAGAEAVQLFDSWAGSLAPDEFERWVIAPNAKITAAIKQSHPDTPVIGFPKGAGAK